MSDGFKNSLHILLIKKLLSGISVLDNVDDDMNFNDQLISSKHEDIQLKVVIENISSTNSVSNFSNLLDNNWPRSVSRESVYNDNYNGSYQMKDEWDDFSDEQKERQLKMMLMKHKSFVENKRNENEIKGYFTAKSHSTANSAKNASFITKCIKQRPMACYDYSCKTRNPSFKRVELLTPVKEKKWFEDYKMELQFLQENFSEVLPEILYDVVRKRVTDPVHYIVHYLIKYKVDKLNNVKMFKHLF